MKQLCFFLLLVFLVSSSNSYAFDIIGLQPIAPNGVFSTFSTDSLPKNRTSFEIGTERSREPDFYRFYLKGSYGISDSVELNLMIPYVYDFLDSLDGPEDISIGFKHRFYNRGKYGLSLAYLINTSIPIGRDEFSTNGRYGIGFILSKKAGPFKGHLNLFYEKPGKGRLEDEIILASGIEFSAANNISFLGEILAKRSYYKKEYNLIEIRFGYRIKTTDHIYTTVGLGFDLKNRSPEYRLMLSVSFVIPYEKMKTRKIYEAE